MPNRWHIQYTNHLGDHLENYPARELAIEAACRHIDGGCDVYRIGNKFFNDSVGKDVIARIYELWLRPKMIFGGRRSQLGG